MQIPWYVNGTLGERERALVDQHLTECPHCRDELQQQQRIQQAMMGNSLVEHMPGAALRRLQQRLDAGDTVRPGVAPGTTSPPLRAMRLAAAAGIGIVVGAAVVVSHWVAQPGRIPDNYVTVTSPATRAPGEIIRAVFAPTVTIAQLQAALNESHLRIVAGPTEAGVYSLATIESQSVNTALTSLRKNPAVRFAEAIEP